MQALHSGNFAPCAETQLYARYVLIEKTSRGVAKHELPAPVGLRVIVLNHWINQCPLDNLIGFGSASCNISNTRKSVLSDIQTLRSGLKKRGAAEFFSQLRSVWISDETLFRVFDIASQNINNSSKNSKQKFIEFYDN